MTIFLPGDDKDTRRTLRTVRSRVERYLRYMTRAEKGRLLVFLDRVHPKMPGRKSHHQMTGYFRDDVLFHMRQRGIL